MKPITFATYNIRHGVDADFDFRRLAESVISCGAEVVGVQEIDLGTHRSRGLDILCGLAAAAEMPYTAFAPSMTFDGGEYGIGIMSKYPLSDIEIWKLPTPDGIEPRVAASVTVTTPEREISFINTHLSYGCATHRAPQFKALAARLPGELPYVVTGDFNTEDTAEFAPLLQAGGVTANRENGEGGLCKTFRQPPAAIDHIFYPSGRLTLLAGGMVDSNHSDHNLFYATLV